MTAQHGYRMASDIGGTFTDTVLMAPDARIVATAKTPTTPEQPVLGALDGARAVLGQSGVNWADITGKIHGTTLATNALIERRGARVATITTVGFRDILEIAYERRYRQYAIDLVKPDLIVPREHALTIGGRMTAAGEEITPLDTGAIAGLLAVLSDIQADAVAICLMHAYANPAHELLLRDHLIAARPDLTVSLSHEISPEAREFDRLCTTIANAYIQPLMASYLRDFENQFQAEGLTCDILMMTAGGGMTTLETASKLPIRLVESGPAGGAILAARLAAETRQREVLSFDMGGTTAKLCLIDDFRPQTARKFEISRAERFVKGSGMPVRIPVVELIEIGAGGGSIARVDHMNQIRVGPHSAGADPGPASFCKGGTQATVTDADVAQGFIVPERFAEGRLQIDGAKARTALTTDIGDHFGFDAPMSGHAVSEFVDENMASAGRMHAVESGKDLAQRLMIVFGGNGPLHATRVARRAQVARILVPPDPGVGSAVGFLYAPVSFELIRSRYTTLETLDVVAINALFQDMTAEAEQVVRAGAPNENLSHRRVAFMRYHGQGHEIEVSLPDLALTPNDLPAMQAAFEQEYSRQFSRTVPGMRIEILNWALSVSSPAPALAESAPHPKTRPISAQVTREITCDITGDTVSAGLFEREALTTGDLVTGPALIIEPQTTTLVSVDFCAEVDAFGNIWMTRNGENH